MHYNLIIEYIMDNTYQVIDYHTNIVYYEGSYEDCTRYKNC